jgi:putative endopeptidase
MTCERVIHRFRVTVLVIALTVAGLSAQDAKRSGIDTSALDRTCKPCDDFWRYANGAWLDKNPIPADRSTWGTFTVLASVNRDRLRGLLDASAADNASQPGSTARKMGDLYASCLDTATIDARGLTPIQPDLDRVARIRSHDDLVAALIAFQHTGRPVLEVNGAVVGPFRVTSGVDPKDPDRVVMRIVERDFAGSTGTSILSLPDRDYFFKDDEASRRVRDQFISHATRLLTLAGTPAADAEKDAHAVFTFESALAASVMTIADKRDPNKTYNPMSLAQLRALAPAFDWSRLMTDLGVSGEAPIIVTEPELLKRVNEQLTSVSIANWKTWLRWRVLKLSAPYLQSRIAAEDFAFERGVLAGVQEPLPRWETCANVVDQDLSDALGEAWARLYFSREAKARMTALVENLRSALHDQLEASWMQPQTKEQALAKLKALRVEVGFPAKWRAYEDVFVQRSTFFENVRSAWTSGQRFEMQTVGKPVDRSTWWMSVPTVNASSSPPLVTVVFPAGILQSPFFDPESDDAVNYGAIGAVIGHEMGHQFDDRGSKYDSTGRLNNWWTPDDQKTFDGRTTCVVDQFNALDVGGGLHHNGKQVLGKALGDLGGATTAYRAYRKSLVGKPDPPPMDGFSADQRFFIAFARVWGTQYRPAAKLLQLNTNNHPLSQYRAIGTLQNMPEFHKAFGCKDGDPMLRPPAQQCSLW